MQRLLLLSCSKRKRPDGGLLPAIDRYDGPAFRILRRYLRSRPTDPPRVFVLSAEFGLVGVDQQLPVYDRQMTPNRAAELMPSVAAEIERLIGDNRVFGLESDRLLVCLGQDYLAALEGVDRPVADVLTRRLVPGGQGAKLARLRDWLYGGAQEVSIRPAHIDTPSRVRLRGVETVLTCSEALNLARHSMGANDPAMVRWHSWYVPLDGQRLAPKWLVSRLTGVEVGRFTTTDALRLLAQLGVEVRRA